MDDRRRTLLDLAVDHVLEHGITTLSLRPLAAALGTSDRMLLFYFDSKSNLVRRILERASDRLTETVVAGLGPPPGSRDELVRGLWRSVRGDDAAPYIRLFFEITGPALRHEEPYREVAEGILRAWIALVGSFDEPTAGAAPSGHALAIVATIEGLLLCRGLLDDARVDGEVDALLRRL